MNPQSPKVPAKVPVQAGGSVAALVPQSLDEAFRVSQAIAASGLAPRGLDKPEQIMVAIMAGAELGLAPFQSLQSIAVVNGRPTLWGDGLMAVARSQGIQAKEWIDGEGDDMVARCEVTRPDSGEVIARTFSVADAKKAGLWGKQGPWQQYPQRMLQMRARAWALRDGCADMIRGFQVREEVEDMGTVQEVRRPETTGMRARLEARRAVGGFDPEHIEAELEGRAEVTHETALPPVDESGAEVEPATVEEIDATLDGDRIPSEITEPSAEVITGSELLARHEAEAEAEAQVEAATGDLALEPEPLSAELQNRLDSFKRGIAAMDDPVEVHAAGEAVKTDGWFLDLRKRDQAAAKGLLTFIKDRFDELKAGGNG